MKSRTNNYHYRFPNYLYYYFQMKYVLEKLQDICNELNDEDEIDKNTGTIRNV